MAVFPGHRVWSASNQPLAQARFVGCVQVQQLTVAAQFPRQLGTIGGRTRRGDERHPFGDGVGGQVGIEPEPVRLTDVSDELVQVPLRAAGNLSVQICSGYHRGQLIGLVEQRLGIAIHRQLDHGREPIPDSSRAAAPRR
jgi:hypothetical protein